METYFDKPIGTQITILSNSVTQLTEGVNNTQDGLAIVANGNTHPQIASGQYVYVKNHESLADGLYKASTAISTNDPLSTSNLTADDSGGLNDLKDSVDSLSEKIGTVPSGQTVEGQISALSSNIIDLDTRKGYFTLAQAQQITTAYVTRNTYNNRKFSDYDLIAVTPVVNGWLKGTSIVARSSFLHETGMEIHTYVGANPLEIDVKYTSDTSYDAKYIGSPGASVYVFIYGIFAN